MNEFWTFVYIVKSSVMMLPSIVGFYLKKLVEKVDRGKKPVVPPKHIVQKYVAKDNPNGIGSSFQSLFGLMWLLIRLLLFQKLLKYLLL